jgi:hypothetical protein
MQKRNVVPIDCLHPSHYNFLFPFKFPSRRYGNMSLVYNHKLPTVNLYSQGKCKGKEEEEEVKEKGTNKRQKVVSYEELNVLRGSNYLQNAHELYS